MGARHLHCRDGLVELFEGQSLIKPAQDFVSVFSRLFLISVMPPNAWAVLLCLLADDRALAAR